VLACSKDPVPPNPSTFLSTPHRQAHPQAEGAYQPMAPHVPVQNTYPSTQPSQPPQQPTTAYHNAPTAQASMVAGAPTYTSAPPMHAAVHGGPAAMGAQAGPPVYHPSTQPYGAPPPMVAHHVFVASICIESDRSCVSMSQGGPLQGGPPMSGAYAPPPTNQPPTAPAAKAVDANKRWHDPPTVSYKKVGCSAPVLACLRLSVVYLLFPGGLPAPSPNYQSIAASCNTACPRYGVTPVAL
jgi:hypothetical protein